MDKQKFGGIYTALLTPFDANNKINEKELEKLVKFNLKNGVSGFYVTGSTAEVFMLSKDERKQVMEIVKDASDGKATLLAHIGSLNVNEAAELGRYAKDLGYDAVSSVAPYYFKFSANEIKDYYCYLADESALPMLVYHIPAFSGVNMGASDLAVYLRDDRFLGIKYTSNDFFTLEQCKTNFPDKIVYNGYDEMCLCGLMMGADGAIGSTYNFMADKFVKIRNLFNAGNISGAQAVQKEANRIITVLCQVGVMAGEKEVLNQLGFDFGHCRKPFGLLNDEQKALIAKEIVPFVTAQL